MDFLVIVLTLLFAMALLSQGLSVLYRIRKKIPPGPTPLPLIGSLHLLGSQPHKSLAKLAKSYGPIMCLKLGQVTTVVFSSPAMAKEVLQKQDLDFSNRWVPHAARAHDHDKYSVLWLPVASQWRNLRKIMSSNIFSANRLDAVQVLRFKKVEELIEYCRKNSQTGEAVNIGRAAFRTTLNLLSNTIFSKDLADPCSDSGKELQELVSNIMVQNGKPNLADFFPILQKFDPQGIKHLLSIHYAKMLKILQGLINERLEEKKSSDIVRNDILEFLLATSQENPEEIDMPHIEHLCLNPEAMEKAKKELAEVIGTGKPIKETDVASLPYLQCIVKETLRLHPPAPFLVLRTVKQDVEVFGYVVPKMSQVIINAWAIGFDPNVWEKPKTFKPERFWNLELDVRRHHFELIPFGAGRRICPGLPLAMQMNLIMLGSLLINTFDWKLEDGITPDQLDMEEIFGISLQRATPLKAIPISI